MSTIVLSNLGSRPSGSNHDMSTILKTLAVVLSTEHKYKDAEKLCRKREVQEN
jgi:hypothetical protein